jgi:hypothetical protein
VSGTVAPGGRRKPAQPPNAIAANSVTLIAQPGGHLARAEKRRLGTLLVDPLMEFRLLALTPLISAP